MIDSTAYNATDCRDGVFGPRVWTEGCRGGFDFTLTFQESLMTIAPSCFFLLVAVPRALYLFLAENKAKRKATYSSKLGVACTLAGIQVALLVLTTSLKQLNTRFTVASAVFNLLAASIIVFLIHLEHVKSIRPSAVLTAYLFVSLAFDAARLRTEWLISVNTSYAAVLSASVALKLALLGLETVEKRRILVDAEAMPSKESTSGPLNRGLFVWLNSLLFLGWGNVLTNDALPAIYEGLSSEHLAERFGTSWDKATERTKAPSLFLTTVKILRWELVGIVLPRAAKIGLDISQPFLISHALRFLSMPNDESTTNLGYGLIGAFALVFIGSAVVTAWYEYLSYRAGAMVRGGLITLIYRKMVKLPTNKLSESSAMALMGNDVETLVERFNALFVESWANILTVAIATWMLAEQLGPVCVAPIIMGLMCLLLSTLVGKQTVGRQKSYQEATQERINFTSAVLGSIKSVKMLGFTERFTELIAQKRRHDLRTGNRFRQLTVYSNGIGNCNQPLTQVATFGAYAIVALVSGAPTFSAAQAITALSILNILMMPLSILLVNILFAFSAFGCFKRIQEFLLLEEKIETRNVHCPTRSSLQSATGRQEAVELQDLQRPSGHSSPVSIVDGDFHWDDANVLNDINLSLGSATKGSLTMVIGPIGSGKSTLLKAILGETPSKRGLVTLMSPDVAYCDQSPWIMNSTVQGNIIAESEGFDETWYDTVIEACDLSTDFARLPSGSSTVVGEDGLKLSGGQKQRIAIARAVYSRKPIAVFDDVLSGLDKVTEQAVFSRVFGKEGLFRRNGTTVIFATHAVHRLPAADYIVALDHRGQVVEQGSFKELRTGGAYVQSLDMSNPQVSDNDDQDEEGQDSAPAGATVISGIKTAAVEGQAAQASPTPSDKTILAYYFASIRPMNIVVIIGLVTSYSFLSTFRNVWITWWGDGRGHASDSLGFWLGIYGGLSVLECVFVLAALAHFLLVMGPVSGWHLHQEILAAVMNAPMYFLSNTDTGSLINRFSQDMRLVDITLPVALAVFLFEVSACFGAASLAIAAVSWFAISIPVVVTVLVMIQRFYVRTSKQLRILEIEHKAPLYSHFLASIKGLVTIRAFGWARQYTTKNLAFLDNAQKPSYLLNCIQRWLNLVLDLVVAVLTVLLVVFAVVLRDKINPSLLGLSLVSMMNLGFSMKGIIMYWSILETSLGAIARIREFSEGTPTERLLPEESTTPPTAWPARGDLDIRNMSVQYDTTETSILRNITLRIKHGEKIGICGRSGSGKSSLVQALLRMVDIVDGEIFLDGQNISHMPPYLIRRRLSCLTQDPFLFTDTIRVNADPLSEHSDVDIVSALARAGLWSVIQAKTEGGGSSSSSSSKAPLDEKMDETFFSHGQRQLFCLARALLKESPVLILDEPTSSVDGQTDAKMQEVIRSEFQGRTIIMIAHRLSTLLDFDRIVVLDRGELVEVAVPGELLGDESSAFSRLYRAAGRKRKGDEAE